MNVMLNNSYITRVLAFMTIMAGIALASCSESDDEPAVSITSGEHFGYHYVDLGLSVRWGYSNYGAYAPEQNGVYQIPVYWGFSTNIPSHISGTEWDRINYLVGGHWRLPTESEINELMNKCVWSRGTLNGVEGVYVKGPNGNSIFFPLAGWYLYDSIPWSDTEGPYMKYSEEYFGYLENGSFDLLIPYGDDSGGFLRYAANNDGIPFFQTKRRIDALAPLRPVLPFDFSESGGDIPETGGSDSGTSGYEKPDIGCYDFTATKTSVSVTYQIYNKSACGNLSGAKIYYGESSAGKAVSASISGNYIKATINGLKAGTSYYVKCSVSGSGGTSTSSQTKVITNY